MTGRGDSPATGGKGDSGVALEAGKDFTQHAERVFDNHEGVRVDLEDQRLVFQGKRPYPGFPPPLIITS